MDNKPFGILVPFRRDKKRDWASGTGGSLLRSKVAQALMTEGTTPQSAGELPWRSQFGSGLTLLRHQKNDETLQELARIYVRDTLRRWVPEATVVEVQARRDVSRLHLLVHFKTADSFDNINSDTVELAI